jgi:hypothetical protein
MLAIVVDFFPEIARLRVVNMERIMQGKEAFPFPEEYSTEKKDDAWTKIFSSYHSPDNKTNYSWSPYSGQTPLHNAGRGVLTFANYLDYSEDDGYTVFHLNMRCDKNGNDILNDRLLACMKKGEVEAFAMFLPKRDARKILYSGDSVRSDKENENRERPLSTKKCKYILF